jgi:hypothetical protein
MAFLLKLQLPIFCQKITILSLQEKGHFYPPKILIITLTLDRREGHRASPHRAGRRRRARPGQRRGQGSI